MKEASSEPKSSEMLDRIVFAIADYANAIESAIVGLRENLKELAEFSEWDPDKITWTQAEGPSGPYERSEDLNNLEFKAMLKDLAAHDGKMRLGPYFYWTFQNGHTVGRKKKA
jgi:hypothetical protein